jgi:hypothetical protein
MRMKLAKRDAHNNARNDYMFCKNWLSGTMLHIGVGSKLIFICSFLIYCPIQLKFST